MSASPSSASSVELPETLHDTDKNRLLKKKKPLTMRSLDSLENVDEYVGEEDDNEGSDLDLSALSGEPFSSSSSPSQSTFNPRVARLVFLMPSFVIPPLSGLQRLNIVQLCHPKTKESCLFLFPRHAFNSESIHQLPGETLLEINKMQADGDYCSWFIDQTVEPDGSLFVASPIDPLFFILPFLRQHFGKFFCSVDEKLMETDADDLKRLLQLVSVDPHLELLCDKKTVATGDFYRFSQAKTLCWLRAKVLHLTKFFLLQKVSLICSDRTASASLFSGSPDQPLSRERLLLCSIEILGEYVEDHWISLLKESFNLKDLPTSSEEDFDLLNDANRFSGTKRSMDSPLGPLVISRTGKTAKKAAIMSQSLKTFFAPSKRPT